MALHMTNGENEMGLKEYPKNNEEEILRKNRKKAEEELEKNSPI